MLKIRKCQASLLKNVPPPPQKKKKKKWGGGGQNSVLLLWPIFLDTFLDPQSRQQRPLFFFLLALKSVRVRVRKYVWTTLPAMSVGWPSIILVSLEIRYRLPSESTIIQLKVYEQKFFPKILTELFYQLSFKINSISLAAVHPLIPPL